MKLFVWCFLLNLTVKISHYLNMGTKANMQLLGIALTGKAQGVIKRL